MTSKEEDKTKLEIKLRLNEPVVYNWKDITNEFKNACQDLNVGELVQVEYFLLFEAMTAIELMDPKMDVGMICNKKKRVLNFEQSIEAGKVKICDFTMEERIGIIDETFACLATWLEGHSLAQTVFTNLYLHNPSLINDRPMKTFCFSMLKIVDFIKQLISNNANVIDEEVFQSMYGFKDNILASSKVSAMLKDLEEESARKCKLNNNGSISSNNSSDGLTKNDLQTAFYVRIKFTRAFYQYLLFIDKQSTDNVQQSTELSKKIEICESTFDQWSSSLEFGLKPDLDEFNKENHSSNDYPTIMGFSQFVNQRTLPPTFPRYTKIKSRTESIEYLRKLIDRFKRIQGTDKAKSFCELFLYCTKLSEKDGFHSCICSRSILNVINNFQPQHHIYQGNFNAMFKDDVWLLVKPFFLQNKGFISNGRTKDYLDYFFEQCRKPLTKLLRTNCLNRTRQREKLESVLYDLSGLVSNSEKLDTYLNLQTKNMEIDTNNADLSYFSCWSSYYLIRSMIQYLLFGFELELYSEHEFCFIYWYLHENLLSWMVSNLVRARNLHGQFENFESLLNGQKQKGGKNSNRQLKQSNKQTKQDQNSFLLCEIVKYNGLQFLVAGLFKICVLLMNNQIIKQPKIIADNHHILYFRRLSSFIGINTPPYVNHSKFKESYERENELCVNKQDYIKQSCDQFEEAKALLVYLYLQNPDDEIDSLLKVVKTNIVVLKLILSGHKQIENIRLDYSVNKLYPIIKMV